MKQKIEAFLDAATNLVSAKKTQTMFDVFLKTVEAGIVLLLVFWLIHQVRLMWGVW